MDEDSNIREEIGIGQGDGVQDDAATNQQAAAAVEAPPGAQVEMINASESINNNNGMATVQNRSPSMRSSAASNSNTVGLSNASHQSMLRQLAHSPTGMARPAIPNRNNAMMPGGGVAHQEALRQAQQQPMQQQQQPPQRQQIHVPVAAPAAAAPNNNNINAGDNAVPERATETEAVYHPCSSSGSASSGWSVVETSQGGAGGAPPSARSLHAAALLNGIMYVFGGYDGSVRVNTFHAFSFAEKRWSPVLPSANSAGPPSPRDRHVAVSFGNSFYVHGGFDGTSRVADLWAFDFSSMTWREIVPLHGRPPSPRHSHAAVVYGSSMYVFGGYDGSYKSDLNEYDFTESRWSVVPAAGRRPRARYRATCVVFRNTMISYGGHDGTRHLSDAHLFDFDTRTWSTLVTEGTPPIPRDSHVSVVHRSSMYCFGGSSGSAMNDLHELQLPSSPSAPAKWRPVKISGVDQPRHRFCHVAVSHNESMFVFGGYDGSERLNDFIRFDFAVYDLSFEVPNSTIISDFRDLINNETLSDVTFLVEEQPVYAHKLMLM
ncbi:effector protein with kelch motifs [Seminavis robusta]|uniref:Effector protein with kelch motifs n=1 Tax=Seminavis robusta TaxID=568900 RepID=A0A9N8EZA8_9STRA|nr:effector protein with kelch motifs [Seminavis robusta]|eukprot:Sro2230_g319990.1 effector protein with kelch motifs (546) ;mRNA; f:3544-5850